MDFLSGDVPLKEIWIVYKEFRISVLGLYVKIMIYWHKRNRPCWLIEDTDHSATQRLFSKCRDVQSYTWFGTSLRIYNDVAMIVNVHGYNTRSSGNMNLYVPKYTKEICKRSFAYKWSMLWYDLPDEVKEPSSLDAFKSKFLCILFIYVCSS